MVLTYGRRRTQKLNRGNEVGLKMSGCPSKIGRPVAVNNYIVLRSKCVILNKIGPNPYKVAYNILVKYFNLKYNNRYSVDLVGEKETLETDLTSELAKRLKSQGGEIIHVMKNSEEYNNAPQNIKQAVDLWNGLNTTAEINKTSSPYSKHVIALVTKEDEEALEAAGFGINIGIKKNNNIVFIKTWALTKDQKTAFTVGGILVDIAPYIVEAFEACVEWCWLLLL